MVERPVRHDDYDYATDPLRVPLKKRSIPRQLRRPAMLAKRPKRNRRPAFSATGYRYHLGRLQDKYPLGSNPAAFEWSLRRKAARRAANS
jgi:hypothetical protein